jgi:hypothetical protein
MGGVGEHLSLHWILQPVQMRGTAEDTLVEEKMIFSHLNMECNRTNFNL